ncbi:MAG TPA: hypothetical protein IAA20_02440 [Candidatus Enterococcus avicola]|uniref:Uncharacterized protein n=1 Tax=Candidatus Enterococcus avicola TaxID=2838561 RepID=A0A9D2JHP0_9ENTE|nr:hypothetical protein [Weissella thailandensis]HIZ52784.1 hypothetical protein [Candidatus Enterococcus avicola]HJA22839.1 hypothetical protein [Candidatus Limosilactobacillus intestinavium]
MFGMMMLILAEHWYQIVLSWIAVMLTIIVIINYGDIIWRIIRGLVLMFSWLLIYMVDGKTRADKIKSNHSKQRSKVAHIN